MAMAAARSHGSLLAGGSGGFGGVGADGLWFGALMEGVKGAE